MATVKVDPPIITKYMQHNGMAMTQKNIEYFVKQFSTKPAAYAKLVKEFGAPAINVDPEVIKKYLIAQGIAQADDPGIDNYVAQNVAYYTSHLDAYADIADKFGVAAPAKAKAPAVKAKAPTLLAQIKALTPSKGGFFNNMDNADIEVQSLIAAVRSALKKKIGGTYKTAFVSAWTAVKTGVDASPDPVPFLTGVLKLFGVNPADLLYNPTKKVEPGKFYSMPVPKDELSKHAKSMLPTPETQQKVNALQEKIAAYEAEITRLKELQEKADNAKYKAEKEKDKLSASIDPKLLKYFSYIEQHCGEYLDACRESRKFLLRGQSDATQKVFIAHPRADREPKDSSIDAQKKIDAALTAYGFKALRGNSIFTSSDENQASNYGSVFAIFPKNGFGFTWTPKHDDLVVNNLNDFIDTGEEDNSKGDMYESLDDDISPLKTLVQDGIEKFMDYQLNIGESSKKYNEVMQVYKVAAKDPRFKIFTTAVKLWMKIDPYTSKVTMTHIQEAFIKVMAAYSGAKAVFPPIEKAFTNTQIKNLQSQVAKFQKEASKPPAKPDDLNKKIIDGFGFRKTDLPAALKSQHEVCIVGEYIAIDWDDYQKQIERYFLGPKPEKKPKSKPAGSKSPKKPVSSDDDDDEYYLN